ncbi:cupin [Arthrobacter sp. MYb227]|uniref:cupin domain-containing protein n=1 Tax=Arthrobacter sp. MYb227 TaxID=1848601 RepID=UPI000CFD6808|nr:cupin domain-containing protein [Arthrobacter sp. MYb227]PQZ94784.1 cupin [Arthrobacter sp. MYb227]
MSNSAEQATIIDGALNGGVRVDVAALELEHQAVAVDQNGGDNPTTGSQAFGTLGGADFGVWEMSAGTMYDVEAEEIFVITAGRGTVVIDAFAGQTEVSVELFPGALMRLSEGMKTTWTVTETLRKVYVTPASGEES